MVEDDAEEEEEELDDEELEPKMETDISFTVDNALDILSRPERADAFFSWWCFG